MNFQGIWTSVAKKTYIFVIFLGEGTPFPPLDPCMQILVIWAGTHKMFVRNAIREDPDQTAS